MNSVSIIIPTYNRSKLVRECVGCLLAQTYPDIEIIVVDDGSTDDTPGVMKSVTDKQSRVSYFGRPHLGPCATRNFGLEQASGEYIGFFDSDDLWPADYIETMVNTLKAMPDYGAVYSKVMLFSDGVIRGEYGNWTEPPSGNVAADLFTGKPFVLPSSVIFRKDIWDGLRWDETILKNGEDLDVFLRISTSTRFIYSTGTYAIRRETSDSISVDTTRHLINNGPRILERFYFRLGGSSYVSRRWAFRHISHRYRRAAIDHYKAGNRTAAIALLKKAFSYQPLDLRLYINLAQALLLNPHNDRMPDWRLPPPLSAIGAGERLRN